MVSFSIVVVRCFRMECMDNVWHNGFPIFKLYRSQTHLIAVQFGVAFKRYTYSWSMETYAVGSNVDRENQVYTWTAHISDTHRLSKFLHVPHFAFNFHVEKLRNSTIFLSISMRPNDVLSSLHLNVLNTVNEMSTTLTAMPGRVRCERICIFNEGSSAGHSF